MFEQQKIKSISDVLAEAMPALNDRAREELAKRIFARQYDSKISENLKLSDVSDEIGDKYRIHYKLDDMGERSKACAAAVRVIKGMNDGCVDYNDLMEKNKLSVHLKDRIYMLDKCIEMYKYSNNPNAIKIYKELEEKRATLKKVLVVLMVSTKNKVLSKDEPKKEEPDKEDLLVAMLECWKKGGYVPLGLEQRLGVIPESLMTESVIEALMQRRLQNSKMSPQEKIKALRGLINDRERQFEDVRKRYAERVLFALENRQNGVSM